MDCDRSAVGIRENWDISDGLTRGNPNTGPCDDSTPRISTAHDGECGRIAVLPSRICSCRVVTIFSTWDVGQENSLACLHRRQPQATKAIRR